jgi:integrase
LLSLRDQSYGRHENRMKTIVVTSAPKPDPAFAMRVRAGHPAVSVGSIAAASASDRGSEAARGAGYPRLPSLDVLDARRSAPALREFASAWLDRQKLEGGRQGTGLAQKSCRDIEWRLSKHLIPAFGETPLDLITREAVDDFRLAMVRESRLGPGSINKLLFTLSAVLETAVEYEVITRNPARGRRRRLVVSAPKRPWLDRADHIVALLDAAGRLDREARVHRGQRRAVLSTLAFAGLRIGEALSLRWSEIDLIRGTMNRTLGQSEGSYAKR